MAKKGVRAKFIAVARSAKTGRFVSSKPTAHKRSGSGGVKATAGSVQLKRSAPSKKFAKK